ncbi:MAG: hypothetical protein J6A21_08125 [Lentisphaeria bacterium]|nr:hypothetical protein [Lentisphaeria bacterium]
MKGTILLGTICAFAAGTLSLFGEKIAVEQFGPAAVKQPDNSYLISSGNYVFSSQLIPVKDLVKETVVTIDLKAPADLAKGVEYYVGILNFDKEGKRIQISYVNPVKGSDTVLAAPCAKTDTVLKVQDGSLFKKGTCIAYETKKDLSDLPNYTATEKAVVRSAEKRGAHWEITLSKPCGVEYPAKTPVRAHFGGWYQYLLCAVKASTLGDWKSYTFKISGTKEGNPCRQWTLGTAGIKFIIFNNGKEKGKDGMFFRNLTVTTPEQ